MRLAVWVDTMALSWQKEILMPTADLILQPDAPDRWERTLYALLAEKERRSGSLRTVQSYSRMLRDFFGRMGKTPADAAPRCAERPTKRG